MASSPQRARSGNSARLGSTSASSCHSAAAPGAGADVSVAVSASDTEDPLRHQPPGARDAPQAFERKAAIEPHQEQADLDRKRAVEETVEHGGERRAQRDALPDANLMEGLLQCEHLAIVEG